MAELRKLIPGVIVKLKPEISAMADGVLYGVVDHVKQELLPMISLSTEKRSVSMDENWFDVVGYDPEYEPTYK